MTAQTVERTAEPVRMPALFLSHGAPVLTDDALWPLELAGWAAHLPRPKSILVVSAHWESQPLTIGATTPVPLYYDFYGFPQRFYEVTYEVPGAPGLADDVRALIGGSGQPVAEAPRRGLDHGAYVPLLCMYPGADIPVLQVSLPTLHPQTLFDIGKLLAPLRDEGVLIVGSGFATHSLDRRALALGPNPTSYNQEFDQWLDEAIAHQDVDTLMDFEHRAPGQRLAHPTHEHFAPLFVTLGASADELDHASNQISGYWMGNSKRSVQIGD
jgi:4,5-DOPA dioxygenase extradiol